MNRHFKEFQYTCPEGDMSVKHMNEIIIQLESMNELDVKEKDNLIELMQYYLNSDHERLDDVGIESYRSTDERKLYKLLGDIITETELMLKDNKIVKME